MILLTMGTYPLAFDRLIRAIDDLYGRGFIKDEIFAQIGYSNYLPRNFKHEKLLEREAFDSLLASATAIIGHAGMGTITLALEHSKPLLAVPRLRKFREHVNDHQVGTARKFEELGHILVAYRMEDIPEKIGQLASFVPKPRSCDPGRVAERIGAFLEGR